MILFIVSVCLFLSYLRTNRKAANKNLGDKKKKDYMDTLSDKARLNEKGSLLYVFQRHHR